MTNTKLYNLIKRTCPTKEATDIINHHKQGNYNEARLLIDDLQEELSNILSDTLDDVAFDIGIQKFDNYQIIWNEMVHNLELEAHDES